MYPSSLQDWISLGVIAAFFLVWWLEAKQAKQGRLAGKTEYQSWFKEDQ